MAITNAQQYKQLLAKGGRTGFFIGGNFSTSSTKDSQKSASKGSTGTTYSGGDNNYNYRGPADLGVTTRTKDKVKAPEAYEIIGGKKYDVTGPTGKDNKEERRILKEIEDDKKQKIKESFVTKPGDYPKYTPAYVKFLAEFNREPNRRFFYENVMSAGKYPGLNYGMSEEEIEEAYQDYMSNRLAGKTDAYGNPTQGFSYDSEGNLVGNFIDNGGGDSNYIPPVIPEDDTTEEDPTVPRNLGGIAPRFAGSIFDFTGLANGGRAGMMDGGMMDDNPTGGIMDLETGRQMYFLGKLVKKATRAVKKVAKSPLGKAALLGGAMYFSGLGGKAGSLFGKGSFFGTGFNPLKDSTKIGPMSSGLGKFLSKFGISDYVTGDLTLGGKIGLGFGLPFALDMLGVGKDDDKKMDLDEYYKTQGINIADIRNRPYNFLSAANQGSLYAADGGLMRMGYQEGGDAEPVAKKTMPLIDMDGKEKDYRETGGFVDMGRMERADDVPARLSKNEFVFTADAVRNAGDGDIDKGAEVMYNMMKNLEDGGDVSEESQGLEGARNMFQTSQRLEEVL